MTISSFRGATPLWDLFAPNLQYEQLTKGRAENFDGEQCMKAIFLATALTVMVASGANASAYNFEFELNFWADDRCYRGQ